MTTTNGVMVGQRDRSEAQRAARRKNGHGELRPAEQTDLDLNVVCPGQRWHHQLGDAFIGLTENRDRERLGGDRAKELLEPAERFVVRVGWRATDGLIVLEQRAERCIGTEERVDAQLRVPTLEFDDDFDVAT